MRIKRSINAHKKRRKIIDEAEGYRGLKKSSYRRAKEQLPQVLYVRLPGSQGAQARVQASLDHPDQRRRAPE